MKILKNISFIISIFSSILACAQNNDVKLETQKLSDHVYMLTGQGGNIGFSVGDDGVLIIDDQFAPLTPKILETIKTISDKPIRYVANTHHHGDHTGGNANLEKTGATIIAHDNVRANLEAENKTEGLPVITFNDKMTMYINGEKVLLFHIDNAHTNGDSMLYFTESNVLHTGDVYFQIGYPFIDLNSNGSVNGYIEGIKLALMVIDDETKIIPGHGKLSNKKEYESFLNMLETLKIRVLERIAKGLSEQEIVSDESITKDYDDLGKSWNFINSEKIRQTFYTSLKE